MDRGCRRDAPDLAIGGPISIGSEGAPPIPRKGSRHQLSGKTLVTGGIERQTDIGTSVVGRWIVDATVGIDFQHVRRALVVDAEIAAAEARPLQSDEEARGLVSEALGQHGVRNGK